MKFIITAILICTGCIASAQTNKYVNDLSALQSLLVKTHSYKSQIKGKKLTEYNLVYDRLVADSVNRNIHQQFYNFAQLIFPIRDNHLAFYQLPDYEKFRSNEAIAQYLTSKEFLNFPRTNLDTDSLKNILGEMPADSVEGIYHYDKFYSVGIFKTKPNEYLGVILHSDVKLWQKGQIAIQLYEYQSRSYKAIYAHPVRKNLILQNDEKYRNQSLINSRFYDSFSNGVYSKIRRDSDYVNLQGVVRFQLKNIAGDVQYLLLRSFQLNKPTIGSAARFHDSIKNSLVAPYLIVDLRNNEGGAKKATKPWYRLLKKYSKEQHIYVVVNNETISRAEIFLLKLMKRKNVRVVGQTTKGMLTYGSNYGKRITLPSGQFQLYPTDMKGSRKHLYYECRGIEPDVVLNSEQDWIKQITEIIRTTNKTLR